MLEIWLVDEHS